MSNMRHDPKVKRLIRKYGSDGWTVYTAIVESIVESLDPINQIVPFLQENSDDIAFEFSIDSKRVEEITYYCKTQGLFEIDLEGVVFCFKIYNYVDEYFTKSQKHKEQFAARNREIIGQYKENGTAAAIASLLKYLPQNGKLLFSISEAYSHTEKGITYNSGVTPDLLSQEQTRTEENRVEETRTEHTEELCDDPPIEIYEQEETEDNDPFADVEIEEAKRYSYSEQEVAKFIAYANSLKCFPAEKRLLINMPTGGQLLDALSYFAKEQIKEALDNYAAIKADPEEYDMRPFKTLVNFFTNDGIPKFISESDPWTNYRRKMGVVESREEREAREANEAYQREKELSS
jgi:hypothetical protein